MRTFHRIRVAADKVGGKAGLSSVRRKRQGDSSVCRLFQRKAAKFAKKRKETRLQEHTAQQFDPFRPVRARLNLFAILRVLGVFALKKQEPRRDFLSRHARRIR